MGQHERIQRTRVTIPYVPRPQFVPFHNRTQRWAWIVAHRRYGKTVGCINDLIKDALTCPHKDPRAAYIAPYYRQAKDVAWNYLKFFAMHVPGADPHESELRVDFPNGGRVRLYGADNYDAMRGIYLDSAVLDENGDMNPKVFPEVIRPALSDRKGRATFIGTPKGRNGFYEIGHGSAENSIAGALNSPHEWFSLILKASETGIIAQSELDDARAMMTPEQYAQEYECSFDAAIVGSYYGKDLADLQSSGRITGVPWDKSLLVDTAWDLGIDDQTSVWFFQIVGHEVRVIDHYSVNNQGLDETAKVVRSKPYTYGMHYLPHDIEIRELMSGKSRRDSLEGLGVRPINVGVRMDPVERVNATRMLLPRCIFDAMKCKQGIESLKHYRREYDDKNKTFKARPLHDWSSHDADAFGEYAANFRERSLVSRPATPGRARVGMVA